MTEVARAREGGGSRLRAARIPAIAVAVTAGAALLVSGCSNTGSSLAQEACVHVDASIHLYNEAKHATTTAGAREKVDRATGQLNKALQFAARATSADPAFNPLMTTLQEVGRTSEANLISALRAQCAAAQHPTSQSPVPGPTQGTVTTGASG